jgi:hypothetical protein
MSSSNLKHRFEPLNYTALARAEKSQANLPMKVNRNE